MLYRLLNFNYIFSSSENRKLLTIVENITSLKVNNISIYKIAFQYKSSKEENYSNERLEFLGDAALSLVIADFLFKKFPNEQEGFLTDIRSRIVNRSSLGIIALKMGMEKILQKIDVNQGKYAYGNALEAFIGAVYLDRGYTKCYYFVEKIIQQYLDLEYIISNDTNFKSAILEWASKNEMKVEFSFIEKFENQGKMFFKTEIKLGEEISIVGEGPTKKESEQNAARKALEYLHKESASIENE